METMKLKLIGTSPLLMHSDRLVNPADPLRLELAQYTSKTKKTQEDHGMIAYLEWKGGMYWSPETGPYLPGRMFKANLIRGATKTKSGPKVRSGVVVMTDKAPLMYQGPRDQDAMWESGAHTDIRSVKVGKARVMRCRPIFTSWSVEFELVLDTAVVEPKDVLGFAEMSGQLVGLGDYRVELGGDFGRYHVEVC